MNIKGTNREIKANIKFLANIDIKAASGEGKLPTFSVRAYNGGPLRVEGYPSPVVLDLKGLLFTNNIIANLDHDETKRVGHVTEKDNDGKRLDLSGTISGTSDAATEVIANNANGFPWEASIEAQPTAKLESVRAGRVVTVNNQQITGPVLIARQAQLYGFAFLTRGADPSTTVTIAASKGASETMHEDTKKLIIAAGLDPETQSDATIKFFDDQRIVKAAPVVTPPEAPTTLDGIVAARKADRERELRIAELADEAIQRNPEEIDEIEIMAKAAIKDKTDVDKFELALIRASRPSGRIGIHTGNGKDVNQRTLEAAVCQQGNLDTKTIEKEYTDQELQNAHSRYPQGIGLNQLIGVCAQAHGGSWNGGPITNEVHNHAYGLVPAVKGQGWSQIDLSGILSNVGNKFLREGFMAVDQAWRAISTTRGVRDFKTVSTYTMTGGLNFEQVAPTGELKHGDLKETPYTNKADTYGKMLALTRVDMINDDLGALTAAPRRLGRGAALSLNVKFWTVYLNDAAFYSAGNANLLTVGAPLDATSLDATEVIFGAQTDPDGNPLGSNPVILLVPFSQRNAAARLMNSQLVVGDTDRENINIFQGRYTIVFTTYLENATITGNDANAFYLLASPADLPTVEVCFLNNQQLPTIQSADAAFNVLGSQIRGFYDYGIALQEYRGGVKNEGGV